jgi:hypothetical protein
MIARNLKRVNIEATAFKSLVNKPTTVKPFVSTEITALKRYYTGGADKTLYVKSLVDSAAQDLTNLTTKIQMLQTTLGMNPTPLNFTPARPGKKPPTKYTLWYKENYPKTVAEFPDYEPQDITKHLSEQWKSLTDKEKDEWTPIV